MNSNILNNYNLNNYSLNNYSLNHANFYQNIFYQILSEKHITFIKWIIEKFKIKNPTMNMLITIGLLFPKKIYQKSKHLYMEIVNLIKILYEQFIEKIIMNKKIVTIQIPYIYMNQINHVFVAFDWYLKTKRKLVNERDFNIVILSDKIEPSSTSKIYNLLKTNINSEISEINYNGKIIKYKMDIEDIISSNNDNIKYNYILTLKSDDMSNCDFDDMTQYIINEYSKSKLNQVWSQKIFTNINDKWISETGNKNKRKIKTIVLKNDVNFKILDELNHFIENENWYLERGIPYKKTYLLYGPHGTGKTSLIKSLSYEIKRHIHFISLSTINYDQDLYNLINKVDLKDTIIVIDDIDYILKTDNINKKDLDYQNILDTITNDAIDINNTSDDKLIINKTNQISRNKITMKSILNILDNLKNNHGMILFITTNHADKLDNELIRDGRIDDRILLGICDHVQIYKMFQIFYNDLNITFEDIKKINLKKTKLSPSDVELIFKNNYKDQWISYNKLKNFDPTIYDEIK
jgi:ATP-dependent Zn protease